MCCIFCFLDFLFFLGQNVPDEWPNGKYDMLNSQSMCVGNLLQPNTYRTGTYV